MELAKKIDQSLQKSFKDLPHLPDSTRNGLADLWPWLALIGGLLQLWGAYVVYRLATVTERLGELANSLSIYLTGQEAGLSSTDKMFIYLGAGVLAVQAVIMLLAFPKLQKRQKAGWNLLFLAALVNIAYSVVAIFIDGRGFGSFIFGLIGTALGFYLLYEVKTKFAK